jgi:hypothetical protein
MAHAGIGGLVPVIYQNAISDVRDSRVKTRYLNSYVGSPPIGTHGSGCVEDLLLDSSLLTLHSLPLFLLMRAEQVALEKRT